jgi:hypothetical protein
MKTYIPLTFYPRKGSRDISDIPSRPLHSAKITLAMRNSANVTRGKPQCVSNGDPYDRSPFQLRELIILVVFFDFHGIKGQVLFFGSVSHENENTKMHKFIHDSKTKIIKYIHSAYMNRS